MRKTDDYKARHRNDVKICVRVVDFCVNILSAIFSSHFELCVVIPVDDLGLCRKRPHVFQNNYESPWNIED